jgi:uncharacterized protein
MNNHTLVFVKYPQNNQVKTRLAKHIDKSLISELYRNFVLDILDTLKNINSKIWICYWPNNLKTEFTDWLGDDYTFIPQTGIDLGERLIACFRQVFEAGAKHALVLGSDSPDLKCETISEAFRRLELNDTVIGPTFDGGYYLLGFRQDSFLPQTFEEIPWSSKDVFKNTMDIIKNYDKSFFVLEKWHDVDTLEDLNLFVSRNSSGPFSNSRSMKFVNDRLQFLRLII